MILSPPRKIEIANITLPESRINTYGYQGKDYGNLLVALAWQKGVSDSQITAAEARFYDVANDFTDPLRASFSEQHRELMSIFNTEHESDVLAGAASAWTQNGASVRIFAAGLMRLTVEGHPSINKLSADFRSAVQVEHNIPQLGETIRIFDHRDRQVGQLAISEQIIP